MTAVRDGLAIPEIRMSPDFSTNLRYFPLSEYYRRRFGKRVYKVSVATARTCPNREGIRGMSVCSFCDQWGSAAYEELVGQPLQTQIARVSARLRERYKAERFLVYFQAYTNTFERISRLEALFEEALRQPDVIGLVVGTRPDCLPRRMLRLMSEIARSHYLSVELGVQSLDDDQLNFLSRGHDGACSLAALESLREYPEIDVCAHLMFGIPGEDDGQLKETAAVLSAQGLQGVKLHNLHVLKNTPLARLYGEGAFAPVSLPEYARKVAVFLEHLAPGVAVHRLNAVASRWEELLAPPWAKEKLGPTQFIRDYMERVDSWQGKHYQSGQWYPPPGLPQGGEAAINNGNGKWG
ncbi:MAG: TIGR01212 family radical SAM protein [SAR324 cluster bacterium]|nr:TIGR01212 family radical SAM protein [SAR324 cluster bacterium]MCZ6841657.1 TIGR01212 family radical SAM protein [SAR324 cluster bacterium]